jgi:ribosomal protein S18 acetylase RimI-like enzyme
MDGLDNPLWASLETMHRRFARKVDGVARYPAEVAPFLAATREGHEARAALSSLVPAGETVYLIGPRPAVPEGWELEDFGSILQMVCDDPGELADEARAGIVELGGGQGDDIRALAALVYPHYFRPRTAELGRYFGIYDGATLAAMIGERMGFHGHREISAVCTHPAYVGKGLARRLLAYLGRDIVAGGSTPFLHVSPGNARAVEIYERNGYRLRRSIPFAALRHG